MTEIVTRIFINDKLTIKNGVQKGAEIVRHELNTVKHIV